MADAERAMRSVFVGNIPYEVTEEKLKEIFSEAGPVQSLKLVYDRDTGKPKGYGFCEYKDAETAMSAMRNLNGFEISGRTLRVDNAGAAGHRVTEMGNGPRHNEPEMNQFGGYGDEGPPPPEKAPEVIAKTVASLPPEQMFELMKQMKMCIQNNPNEARTMLLQNPQLAYALLQALVVMKIVDPTVAISMLHKDSSVPIGSLLPEGQMGMIPGSMPGPAPPQQQPENPWLQAVGNQGAPLMPMNPPGPFGAGSMGGPPGPQQSADLDMRAMDPRLRGAPVPPSGKDFDLRDPRAGGFGMDPRRDRGGGGDRDRDLRDPRGSAPSSAPDPRDPRSRRGGGDSSTSSSSNSRSSAQQQTPVNPLAGLAGPSGEEQQRLIKLVMNLSDEQIRQLPAEQQQSIKMLKDQIARSKPH